MKNIHLIEYVKTTEGKKIVLNRVVRDEDWFDTIDAIMIEYNAVYVSANHNTEIKNGKALTNAGEWVNIRTKSNTSMKVGRLVDKFGVQRKWCSAGNEWMRKVTFGTEALSKRMLEVFKREERECYMEGETTVVIPYRWGILSSWEIAMIYQQERVFF